MAFAKNPSRQESISAYADFALADLTSATYKAMIDLPLGAIVVGGGVFGLTAFNSGTSDKFAIGDQTTTAGVADSATKTTYSADSADVKTLTGQFIAVTPTGVATTKPTTVGITYTTVGTAPSTGTGRLIVRYIVLKREEFTQS